MNKRLIIYITAGLIILAAVCFICYRALFTTAPNPEESTSDGVVATSAEDTNAQSFGDEINRDQNTASTPMASLTPASEANLKLVANKIKICFQLDDTTKVDVGTRPTPAVWEDNLRQFLGSQSSEQKVEDEIQLQYSNGSNAVLEVAQDVVHGIRIEAEAGTFTCDDFNAPNDCVCE